MSAIKGVDCRGVSSRRELTKYDTRGTLNQSLGRGVPLRPASPDPAGVRPSSDVAPLMWRT